MPDPCQHRGCTKNARAGSNYCGFHARLHFHEQEIQQATPRDARQDVIDEQQQRRQPQQPEWEPDEPEQELVEEEPEPEEAVEDEDSDVSIEIEEEPPVPRVKPGLRRISLVSHQENEQVLPTQVKIWLLTWNCGNKAPDDDQLAQLLGDDLNSVKEKDKPDLVVIGLQEFKRGDQYRIAQRLATPKFAGSDFAFLDEQVKKGISGGGRNCQVIGVLVNRDRKSDVKLFAKTRGTRVFGKGGVIMVVQIRGMNIAFVSAHLDSYHKREADTTRVINCFSSLVKKQKDLVLDAVFMMGDLNFRLEPKESSILSPVSSRFDIATLLFDQVWQNKLHEFDEINRSSLVTGTGGYKFEFPQPKFPPTYKLHAEHQTEGWLTNSMKIILTYFGKGSRELPPRIKEKRTAYDFGWLDRIGWATEWRNQKNSSLAQDAKVEIDLAQEKRFIARHGLVMSDHAAVIMKVTVTKQVVEEPLPPEEIVVQEEEAEPEEETWKMSEVARKYGFTHVAHYTNQSKLFAICNQGCLDTPKNTGQSNFDFEEYNNEEQIFLGLVSEDKLEVLKHYGSHAIMFDLDLLDGRDDFFVNILFTGTYTEAAAARKSDGRERMEELLKEIVDKGSHEVVFQSKIEFSKTPPARIHILGDPPKWALQQYRERMSGPLKEHGIYLFDRAGGFTIVADLD